MTEVPPGLCFERSPRLSGSNMPYLCELKAGHLGAHQAGTTHWSLVEPMHEAYHQAYAHLKTQLASPPEGWYTFGSHDDPGQGTTPELEFWGDDGTGLPLWEKVKDNG